MIVTLFKTFLLPPALQLMMVVISVFLWKRWKIISRSLMFLAWFSLYLLSLPIVSASLFGWLESPYLNQAAIEDALDADAVVILGGGRESNAPEYGGHDQVSYSSLWRLRYGARLAKEHQLPVLVSGGTVYPYETISEAAISSQLLQQEFGVSTVWEEGQSRDTWQNAQKTSALLKQKGIDKVALVTHAYHMRRAEYAFAQANVDVLPMATGFFSASTNGWIDDWLPRALALKNSRIALHEYLGLIFYRLRD